MLIINILKAINYEVDVSVSSVRKISVLMVSTLHLSVNNSTVQSYWPSIQVNDDLVYGLWLNMEQFYNLFNFLDISRSGNKSSLVELIQSYGLNVQVVFLGPNLDNAVAYFER